MNHPPPAKAGAPPDRSTLVNALLRWFGPAARDLPWRRTLEPYAIWVSEIMLQQTQVRTVIPYWERWMRTLPTVFHLAKARPQRLHKLWEGLGYYSRVRNLQRAARLVVRNHDGQLPGSLDALMALPGIGRYTAGAILSIAFDQPAPILDGNVTRVLSRLFAIDGNPRDTAVNARLWHLAEALVRTAASQTGFCRPCSHFNQALMELGALVCSPRDPDCGNCPLGQLCRAREQNCVSKCPGLPKRPKVTRRRFAAFVVQSGDRFLVRQRPPGMVNGHLWEFPNTEAHSRLKVARAAHAATGLLPRHVEHICRINHTITRYRITTDVFRIFPTRPARTHASAKWLPLPSLQQLPFSSAHKKILSRLVSDGNRAA